MHYLLFILICFIWGSSFILIKKASFAFGPISIGSFRAIGGSLTLLIIIAILKNKWEVKKAHFLPIAFIALAANILPYTTVPYLISLYGSAFIGMMVGLVPFMTIIFSIPMLEVWPTRLQMAGVAGGLICLVIIFSDGLRRNIPLDSLCLAIMVPVVYSFSTVYIKKNLNCLSPLSLTCALLTLSGLFLLPFAIMLEPVHTVKNMAVAIFSLSILGIFCTGIATYMFLRLTLDKGPLFAGMVTYVIPVIALAWGWIDSESISLLQTVAVTGILFSVATVNRTKST